MKAEDVFSPLEKEILKLITLKKITISEIVDKYNFIKRNSSAVDPNNKVSSAILRINRKCKHYKLDWFIEGEGLGRGGKTVWIQKKK